MRHASAGSAVAVLVTALACRAADANGLTLLFFNRYPAATLDGRSWAADPDHSRLIAFDGRLRPVRIVTSSALAVPVGVTAYRQHLLVSEQTGDGVLLDTAGALVAEWESTFPASIYAAAGARIVAARSPYRVPLLLPDAPDAPLLVVLDSLGHSQEGLGTIHVPETPFLAQITNAGAVTADTLGTAYYAPLVRDEILRIDASGATRWRTTRGLMTHESDPVYVPDGSGQPQVKQAVVNVALVLGPDGHLYALGASDSAGTRLRVDVIDTATGSILATRPLDATETAVALDRRGRLVTRQAAALLATALAPERQRFAPEFSLPDTTGDTVSLAQFAGKVTLIDFWASWCDPCREEFPHMIALYGELPRQDFEIVAISDDVDRGKMLAFIQEYRPPFPVLVGAGRMKQRYHYRGLPYSVLIDRKGRVIERYFGFGGAAEFTRLRATIAAEIRAP